MNSTTVSSIVSTAPTLGVSGADSAIGYVACLISCIAFGTMFAPLKKSDCRDGMFVQWVQCSIVFLFGFSINIVRWFPKFEPIAAIGGLLYATGNVFSVPIVDGIGIGLGMLIWGTIQVIVGWSVARFGLFSLLNAAPVEHNALNYAGMFITLICGILFVFVKHSEPSAQNEYEFERTETTDSSVKQESELEREDSINETARTTWGQAIRKLPFIGMAVCLGILHGLMMCPIDILKQKEPSDDKYRVLDFCFSYFCSVFFFSTIYFIVYCLVRREKVYITKELVIPSVCYGILWNIGMTLWFISSDKLQQTVAYPITTRLPAIIGAFTDVFIYKTVKGRSNIIYLAFVILLGIAGVVLIALSNQKF